LNSGGQEWDKYNEDCKTKTQWCMNAKYV
jgi:hypothetical protein